MSKNSDNKNGKNNLSSTSRRRAMAY